MNCSRAKGLGILLGALILIATIAFAGEMSPSRHISDTEYVPQEPMKADGKDLTGRLAIYMIEPTGRWNDYSGTRYHNAFIGWAYNGNFSLTTEFPELNLNLNWTGDGQVESYNLQAIAVVTDLSHGYQQYSDPPSGSPFVAYYHVASAAAMVDSQWANYVDTQWTHTVFDEVGTSTSCPSCPAMNSAMNLAHIFYPDHHFHYTEMVVDMNTNASNWMNNTYNLHWVPTAYFDGGYSVMIGASGGYGAIAAANLSAGSRNGIQLGLTLSLTETSKGEYELVVACAENQFPDVASTPTGETAPAVDEEYLYTTQATDPDGNDVYIKLNVSGTETGWYGPYASGAPADIPYTFTVAGTYYIKAKAKDKFEFESDWSDSLVVEATDFVCDCEPGNANGDELTNIFDVTYVISFLYKGGPEPTPYPICSGDPNGMGCTCNIFDVTYLISFLYKSGPAPVTCEDWLAACGMPLR